MVNVFIQIALSAVVVGCCVVVLAYDSSLLTVKGGDDSVGCDLRDCTSSIADKMFTLCDARADGRKAALGVTCVVLAWEPLLLLLRAACAKRAGGGSAAAFGHFLSALLLLVLIGLTAALVKADFPEQKLGGVDVCKKFGDYGISSLDVTVGPAPYLFAAAFVVSIVSGVFARKGRRSAGYSDI